MGGESDDGEGAGVLVLDAASVAFFSKPQDAAAFPTVSTALEMNASTIGLNGTLAPPVALASIDSSAVSIAVVRSAE